MTARGRVRHAVHRRCCARGGRGRRGRDDRAASSTATIQRRPPARHRGQRGRSRAYANDVGRLAKWPGLVDDQGFSGHCGVIRQKPTTCHRRDDRRHHRIGQRGGRIDLGEPGRSGPAVHVSRFLRQGKREPIFTLMGRVEAVQRWGIGTIAGSRFKGGWGPSPTGAYLVRQIGIITTPNGMIAVALAAQPASGTYDDGTADLPRRWPIGWPATSRPFPAGGCGR